MPVTGRCQCGAIEYTVADGVEPAHHALCHCEDCRRSAGAPMVAWLAFPSEAVQVTRGEPAVYHGKAGAERSFCGTCGSGLLYRNAQMLPGITDIQSATLDDPAAFAPQAHIQTAEALPWIGEVDALPKFARYPGME